MLHVTCNISDMALACGSHSSAWPVRTCTVGASTKHKLCIQQFIHLGKCLNLHRRLHFMRNARKDRRCNTIVLHTANSDSVCTISCLCNARTMLTTSSKHYRCNIMSRSALYLQSMTSLASWIIKHTLHRIRHHKYQCSCDKLCPVGGSSQCERSQIEIYHIQRYAC